MSLFITAKEARELAELNRLKEINQQIKTAAENGRVETSVRVCEENEEKISNHLENLGFNVIPDHRRFDYIAVSWAKLNTPN